MNHCQNDEILGKKLNSQVNWTKIVDLFLNDLQNYWRLKFEVQKKLESILLLILATFYFYWFSSTVLMISISTPTLQTGSVESIKNWIGIISKHTGSLWLDLFQSYKNIVFAKILHFLALVALKNTKKPIKVWKRPQKAVKVISKARESENGKILILLHFCDHLVSIMMRIQYFDVSRS